MKGICFENVGNLKFKSVRYIHSKFSNVDSWTALVLSWLISAASRGNQVMLLRWLLLHKMLFSDFQRGMTCVCIFLRFLLMNQVCYLLSPYSIRTYFFC